MLVQQRIVVLVVATSCCAVCRNASAAFSVGGYGGATAHPIPADYDGDGKADLSVKTNDGRWLIDYAKTGFGSWNASFTGY